MALFTVAILLILPRFGPVAMAVGSALALVVYCFVLKFSTPVVRAGFIGVTAMMVVLAGYLVTQFLRGQLH